MRGFPLCRRSMFRLPLLGIVFFTGLLPAATHAQPTELSGLGNDAFIFRDSNGIPHICAGSERDAFFMQGYAEAEDRFFQMDTLRHTFSGTLAELVGQGALASDVQLRTFGLRRAAEASLAAYQAAGLSDTMAALDAYAKGVNRYLESHPLPPEYAALELTQVAPWTALDSVTLVKGLAFGLSFDLLELDLTIQAGTYAAVGAALGFDGLALLFEDTTRHAPFDPTVSIPQAATTGSPKGAYSSEIAVPDPRTVALARQYRQKAARVPLLEKAMNRRASDEGSNWWLVSAEKSETGFAMLANDPHLALNTPSTFYEVHLIASAEEQCGIDPSLAAGTVAFRGDGGADFRGNPPPVPLRGDPPFVPLRGNGAVGLDANGVSFAGIPTLVLGCNTAICWGATVNPMDVTDVYQEVLVVDPQTGVPVATVFDGQQEPLVLIPQTYMFNVLGDQMADNLADAGIGPLEGGLTMVVPRRNNGPIVQVDASGTPVIGFSVQYTGWSASLEIEAFRRFLHAGDVNDFADGLQYFDVGSQNFSFADVAGNIAYFTSAELPIREDLQTLGSPAGGVPPFLIRDGTHTLPHEWMAIQNPQPQQSLGFEILPFSEMPQVVNPQAGYVVNANNDPVGNTLDNNVLNEVRPGGGAFYLSPGYASLRVGRVGRMMEALLEGGGKASVEELEQMQANNQLLDAELVAPYLIAAFANASDDGAPAELAALVGDPDPGIAEAVIRLMAWDYSTPTGIPEGYDPGDDPQNLPQPGAEEINHSVAATLWSTFRGQAVANVIDSTLTALGLGDVLPDSRSAYKALAHHLMQFDSQHGVGASGVDFFQGPEGLTPEQSRDLILLQSLRQALDLLASDEFAAAFGGSTDQNDYRWGYLHRIEFDHLLGGPFSIPPAGGFQPVSAELRGVARSGGYEAVDASSHSARADDLDDFMFGAGPARRFVGLLDPGGIVAEQIVPGGESGVVVSPHYASELGRWLTNDYHPLLLDPADVAGEVVSQTDFEPACMPGATTLCFQDYRFKADMTWSTAGGAGSGKSVPGASNASGNFHFFDPENWEILVKVLDGCAFNGHYWVFASGATDLGWELAIEDTESGEIWTASNPLGQRSPAITDTQAFATCP